MRLLRVALLAVALAGAAGSSGCQRSMAPLCRQLCACSPCSQVDFDACVTKAETAQQSAEKSGCADPFDTLVSCLEDKVSCGKNGAGPGTDQCVRADRAMVVCDGSVSPFGSVCDESSVKIEACTGTVAPPQPQLPPQIPCAGFRACAAKCTLAQPCEVLSGTTSKDPLIACVATCQMVMGGGPPPGGGPKHD